MKILKLFIFAILSLDLITTYAMAQTGHKIRERKPPEFVKGGAHLKTLAEGSDASVTTPFIFVARSAETFAQLQKLVKNLPADKIDFNQSAVIAVFAGLKNTGGFSLGIEKSGDTVSVKIVAPPKDAFVTENLTMPYKVALVEIGQENSLKLALSADFSSASKNYRLTSGEFEFSGGIAGRLKKFAAEGTINVLSFGEYVTMIFKLSGKAVESRRKLSEAASGVSKGVKINLARVEAVDFIDRPHPFLIATGTLSKDKIILKFAPGKRDEIVNDGYVGGGKLEAVKIK